MRCKIRMKNRTNTNPDLDIFDENFEITYDGSFEDVTFRPAEHTESVPETRRPSPSESRSAERMIPEESTPHRTTRSEKKPASIPRPAVRKKRRGVPLASPIRKGGMVLSRIIHAVVSSLTVCLILASVIYVIWTFWRASTPYGDIVNAAQTKSISETLAAYLCVPAVFVFWELIFLFWSMSRVKVRGEYGSRRVDTGRGLSSFVLVFASSYAAFLFSSLIPEMNDLLIGLKAGLDVYGSMHNVLFGFCCAGVISCIVRKFQAD